MTKIRYLCKYSCRRWSHGLHIETRILHTVQTLYNTVALSLIWNQRTLVSPLSARYGSLTRYVKLWVAHAPGMPGTISPPPRVSDPHIHHGRCVTQVPWCRDHKIAVSFEVGSRENVTSIPGACATRNFTYLVRSPWCVICGFIVWSTPCIDIVTLYITSYYKHYENVFAKTRKQNNAKILLYKWRLIVYLEESWKMSNRWQIVISHSTNVKAPFWIVFSIENAFIYTQQHDENGNDE